MKRRDWYLFGPSAATGVAVVAINVNLAKAVLAGGLSRVERRDLTRQIWLNIGVVLAAVFFSLVATGASQFCKRPKANKENLGG